MLKVILKKRGYSKTLRRNLYESLYYLSDKQELIYIDGNLL